VLRFSSFSLKLKDTG